MVQVGKGLLLVVEVEMSAVAGHCLVSPAPSLAVPVHLDAGVEVGYLSRDDGGNGNVNYGGGVDVALDHCCVAFPHPYGARVEHSQRLPVRGRQE